MLVAVGATSSSASMREASNAAASLPRLGFTPSIQMVSELTWKNGASPSCGSALTTPPAVPSSYARSSEITICGAAGEVALDLIGEMMHVHHRALDTLLGEAIEHIVDQRLAADLHQRLGDLPAERPHAGAEPGGEHHGAFRRSFVALGFGHSGFIDVECNVATNSVCSLSPPGRATPTERVANLASISPEFALNCV